MAVGLKALVALAPVAGVRVGTASAGIKKAGKLDLVVFELSEGATVASAFTKNQFCAAPVQVAKKHLAASAARYLLINTGNANAGTGQAGRINAIRCCETLAALTGVAADAVLPFSTGVIGEPLPVEKIETALPGALENLVADGWNRAATGIMTTDTLPKGVSKMVLIDGKPVTITGIAKGAGMIKPNMATMLSYIATDAAVDAARLQSIFSRAVDRSFNRITVDGDTSTNDAAILVATGKSGVVINDANGNQFEDAVTVLCIELAQMLVRDGEGATKFVAVVVNGGAVEQECLKAAYTIAESPLVKTALFASDPNWGRLLAAIGRAGIEALDVDLVELHINGVLIAENGCRAASYTEAQGVAAMAGEEIEIRVNLNRGAASTTVWTTDLSHDYVTINAEYRT
jgi:glutamate N-acetyltransferase / amino-acid N-acetyltransferase